MRLNEWDRALQLSNQYTLNINVEELFCKHATQLLQRGRILDTVQLYRKANRFLEAAQLLFEVCKYFWTR